jgi:hypothetical protein
VAIGRKKMPTIYLTLANKSKALLLVQIEPEGADFWLRPGEEFDLEAQAKKEDGRMEVHHCDCYVAVFPATADVGYISVMQKGVELECGHQRPAGWPEEPIQRPQTTTGSYAPDRV